VIEVFEYLDANGMSPYRVWFDRLSAPAAAKVAVHVQRMAQGNLSNVDPVGEGVLEREIDWGPGYLMYFGRDGATRIILLGGGSKKGQPRDIKQAKDRWADYRRRRRK
jgi:putative addiction module killer protein